MNNLKPTIAFFGSSLVSVYWNGAVTSDRLDRIFAEQEVARS
jgi:hypothetical protein